MRKLYTRFFTIADYEEEEVWLRKQHLAGWKLVKTVLPCFFIFERCAPEDVVYRLDFKNNRGDTAYLQLLRDYGWEYFNACAGWLYFRKPAAEMCSASESELFSDGASKVEMVSRILRRRLLPILLIFLACVLPNFARAMLGKLGVGFFWFYILMLFLYLWLFLHCGLKLRKLRRKYQGEQ